MPAASPMTHPVRHPRLEGHLKDGPAGLTHRATYPHIAPGPCQACPCVSRACQNSLFNRMCQNDEPWIMLLRNWRIGGRGHQNSPCDDVITPLRRRLIDQDRTICCREDVATVRAATTLSLEDGGHLEAPNEFPPFSSRRMSSDRIFHLHANRNGAHHGHIARSDVFGYDERRQKRDRGFV